jgi:hypothetical protein
MHMFFIRFGFYELNVYTLYILPVQYLQIRILEQLSSPKETTKLEAFRV